MKYFFFLQVVERVSGDSVNTFITTVSIFKRPPASVNYPSEKLMVTSATWMSTGDEGVNDCNHLKRSFNEFVRHIQNILQRSSRVHRDCSISGPMINIRPIMRVCVFVCVLSVFTCINVCLWVCENLLSVYLISDSVSLNPLSLSSLL